MSRSGTAPAHRTRAAKHRRPRCEHARKVRFRDGKDARLALDAIRIGRDYAVGGGEDGGRIPIRSYKCSHCKGHHLTSQPIANPAHPRFSQRRVLSEVAA